MVDIDIEFWPKYTYLYYSTVVNISTETLFMTKNILIGWSKVDFEFKLKYFQNRSGF